MHPPRKKWIAHMSCILYGRRLIAVVRVICKKVTHSMNRYSEKTSPSPFLLPHKQLPCP